jgi:hypothetical protein
MKITFYFSRKKEKFTEKNRFDKEERVAARMRSYAAGGGFNVFVPFFKTELL